MGATASRVTAPPRDIIEDLYDRQRQAVIAYMGWHGVGISMFAKGMAKAAKESNHFDPVVVVTAGESSNSLRKLQRSIAEQLGLTVGQKEGNDDDIVEEERIDEIVIGMIYRSLAGRNFLLIIDTLLQVQGINDLQSIGVPNIEKWMRSKILITTPYFQVIRAMSIPRIYILQSNLEDGSHVPSDIRSVVMETLDGGVDGLLEHFRDEADDVANTLGINDQVEQVFNCCIYLCLFQRKTSTGVDAKELMKYYVGEGFITTKQRQQQLDGLDGLEGAFRHGKAVLAQLISRFMVEETSSSSSSAAAVVAADKNISLNSHLWTIFDGQYLKEKLHIQLEVATAGNCMLEDNDAASVRWVSLSHNKIQATDHLPPLILPTTRCAHQLSTLLLNDNPQLKQIPDTFFHQIPNLKVLDLSRTSISSFPTSFSSLVHLTFLKLQECLYLDNLPPSLKHLTQLIILDLRGTPFNSVPSEALEQKTNLGFIDLSHANISHLPPSFSALCNLEKLRLAGCNAFEGLKPCQSRLLLTLEELDLSACGALKDVENLSFQDLPKLRALNLSHTKVAHLSITRCASLETVRLQGLANLKLLHLSSIKIKEFPHEISELTRLEELHLTDVKQLRRVEWEKVQWLPQKLEWDKCGCWSSSKPPATNNLLLLLQLEEELGSENRQGGGGGAFVSVSNGNIFKGLSSSSPLWKQSFLKFHFYISPCLKQKEKKEKEKQIRARVGDVEGKKQQAVVVAYAGIYSKIKTRMDLHYVGRRKDFRRRLEIEGVGSLSLGDRRSLMETVVRRAEVLWLRENGFVKSLSDLIDVGEMEGVEECWVERCHNINILFADDVQAGNSVGPSQRLWVSELGSLRNVYDGINNFRSLKHLHIQCCPKLDTLFSHNPYLIQLETLHIRFCTRLESVFKGDYNPSGEEAFPQLRSLYLWELSKLKQICPRGSLPSLQHLRVRGCQHLQHLLSLDPRKMKKIEGESEWWRNLKWNDNQREMKEGLNLVFESKGGRPKCTSNHNI